MSSGSVARRYAKALMLLAEADQSFAEVGSELRTLAAAMQSSPQLGETLTSPVFPKSERRKVVDALLTKMSARETVRNFTLLLLDRGRIGELVGISRELDQMIDERLGRIKAEVISATALDAGVVGEIQQRLETLSGKKVEMATSVDAELLGGVVAKLGDTVYDGSLRTQLQQIRDSLAG